MSLAAQVLSRDAAAAGLKKVTPRGRRGVFSEEDGKR